MLCETYVRTPSKTRFVAAGGSRTKTIAAPHAATVPNAVIRNGAGCQRSKRSPPPIRPTPIATPAQQVLDSLRAAVLPLRQEIRVQAAVRRLVEVVREEEPEQDQRHQPEARHERDERQAETHRPERRRA